jgi:hypothetical protein
VFSLGLHNLPRCVEDSITLPRFAREGEGDNRSSHDESVEDDASHAKKAEAALR